jgi:hypothetical protein
MWLNRKRVEEAANVKDTSVVPDQLYVISPTHGGILVLADA